MSQRVLQELVSAVSLMVMIPAFHAGGPGSIPGRRILWLLFGAHNVFEGKNLELNWISEQKIPPPGLEPGSLG